MRFRSLAALVLLAAGAIAPAAAGVATSPAGGFGTQTRLAVLTAGPVPVPTPFPLSHVGVRWRGSEHVALEVRTGAPDRLGPWRRLPVAHDLGDHEAGRWLSGLLRADGATAVQARAGGDAHGLEIVVIDATSASSGSAPATSAPGSADPPIPDIVPRAGWGADEGMRRGSPRFAPLSKLVVHHTVTPNGDPDPASTVRAIYAYHTRQRGWNDIGYNFLVDAAGRIYEGRYSRAYAEGETPTGEDRTGRGVVGAHVRGYNTGSVGVALLGDFSQGAGPTDPALDSLVRLLAWKAARHDIDPHGSSETGPDLGGHRDLGVTACPGDRLYERLPEVRDRVAAAIGAAPTPLPPPPAPIPPIPGIPGLWTVTAEGQVRAHGDAPTPGDLAGLRLAAPVVGLAPTRSGEGYWLVAADGGVFAFGDAPFLGSAAGRLAQPAVELEPTPSGGGYWVASAGGEVLAFGDAVFLGGTTPLPLEVAGLAATPSGRGYWLATTDGRVVPFGDALTRGATSGRAVLAAAGETAPAAPVVSITAHPGGRGYWLLGSDGGVFSSEAGDLGSVAEGAPRADAVRLRATPSGEGYLVAGADGTMFGFGDADRRWRLDGVAAVVDFGLRSAQPRRQAIIW